MASTKLALGELPRAPGFYEFYPYTQTVFYDGVNFHPAGPASSGAAAYLQAGALQSASPTGYPLPSLPAQQVHHQQQQPQHLAAFVCGKYAPPQTVAPSAVVSLAALATLSFIQFPARVLAAADNGPHKVAVYLPHVAVVADGVPAQLPASPSGTSSTNAPQRPPQSRENWPNSSQGLPETYLAVTGPPSSRRKISSGPYNPFGESTPVDEGSVEEIEINLHDCLESDRVLGSFPVDKQAGLPTPGRTDEQPIFAKTASEKSSNVNGRVSSPSGLSGLAIMQPVRKERISAVAKLSSTNNLPSVADAHALATNLSDEKSASKTSLPELLRPIPSSPGPVPLELPSEHATHRSEASHVQPAALDEGSDNTGIGMPTLKTLIPASAHATASQSRTPHATGSNSGAVKPVAVAVVRHSADAGQPMASPVLVSRRRTTPVPLVDGWGETDDRRWRSVHTPNNSAADWGWDIPAPTVSGDGWGPKPSNSLRKNKTGWNAGRTSTVASIEQQGGLDFSPAVSTSAVDFSSPCKPGRLSTDINKLDSKSLTASCNHEDRREAGKPTIVRNNDESRRDHANSVIDVNVESSGWQSSDVKDSPLGNTLKHVSLNDGSSGSGNSAKPITSESWDPRLRSTTVESVLQQDLQVAAYEATEHLVETGIRLAADIGKHIRHSDESLTASPVSFDDIVASLRLDKQIVGEAGKGRRHGDISSQAVCVNDDEEREMVTPASNGKFIFDGFGEQDMAVEVPKKHSPVSWNADETLLVGNVNAGQVGIAVSELELYGPPEDGYLDSSATVDEFSQTPKGSQDKQVVQKHHKDVLDVTADSEIGLPAHAVVRFGNTEEEVSVSGLNSFGLRLAESANAPMLSGFVEDRIIDVESSNPPRDTAEDITVSDEEDILDLRHLDDIEAVALAGYAVDRSMNTESPILMSSSTSPAHANKEEEESNDVLDLRFPEDAGAFEVAARAQDGIVGCRSPKTAPLSCTSEDADPAPDRLSTMEVKESDIPMDRMKDEVYTGLAEDDVMEDILIIPAETNLPVLIETMTGSLPRTETPAVRPEVVPAKSADEKPTMLPTNDGNMCLTNTLAARDAQSGTRKGEEQEHDEDNTLVISSTKVASPLRKENDGVYLEEPTGITGVAAEPSGHPVETPGSKKSAKFPRSAKSGSSRRGGPKTVSLAALPHDDIFSFLPMPSVSYSTSSF